MFNFVTKLKIYTRISKIDQLFSNINFQTFIITQGK